MYKVIRKKKIYERTVKVYVVILLFICSKLYQKDDITQNKVLGITCNCLCLQIQIFKMERSALST